MGQGSAGFGRSFTLLTQSHEHWASITVRFSLALPVLELEIEGPNVGKSATRLKLAHQSAYNSLRWGPEVKILNIFQNQELMCFSLLMLLKKNVCRILSYISVQHNCFQIPKSKLLGLHVKGMPFILFLRDARRTANTQGLGVVGTRGRNLIENSYQS